MGANRLPDNVGFYGPPNTGDAEEIKEEISFQIIQVRYIECILPFTSMHSPYNM